VPFDYELLASLEESTAEKKIRISPFLDFLGGGEPKNSVSDEDSAALQNWVVQKIVKQIRFVKNPSITVRRDSGLIAGSGLSRGAWLDDQVAFQHPISTRRSA
jgi:hypothetical protein